MGPSDKVTKTPVVRISNGDTKEWIKFIAFLPITQKIWTNVPVSDEDSNGCVEDEQPSDRKRGNKFNVHLALEPKYDDIDLIPMVSAWYNTGDKARITDQSYSSTPLTDELEARTDIFGFEGTWEEVTLKLIELNNIVFSSIPNISDSILSADIKR
ncbi:MAG: hypothetical protein WCO65_02260 [bacterium]